MTDYSTYHDDRVGLFGKLFRLNWPIILLVSAIACIGFLTLYSVAGGGFDPWAKRQMVRFGVGFAGMIIAAMVDIRYWRMAAAPFYVVSVLLLVAVDVMGSIGMGAQRWIDLGPVQLQPSEVMKISLVMALARYYDWLDPGKVNRPLWVGLALLLIAVPAALVLKQPDLGTAILLGAGGATVMFLAGLSWWYFVTMGAAAVGVVSAVFASRGTEWQLLKDYQFRRIETFLDPSTDPLGAGYHITQSKIAFGSGGLTGRGFMQGTQSQLNFLPEKHTDFIFTTLAEEFGFFGTMSLLLLYALVILFCVVSVVAMTRRFRSLRACGLTMTFFLLFSINMAMVTGLAPVVGVPLPLVSYGGSSLMVLLFSFGVIQSAYVHRHPVR